jgi:hypothetical protein
LPRRTKFGSFSWQRFTDSRPVLKVGVNLNLSKLINEAQASVQDLVSAVFGGAFFSSFEDPPAAVPETLDEPGFEQFVELVEIEELGRRGLGLVLLSVSRWPPGLRSRQTSG